VTAPPRGTDLWIRRFRPAVEGAPRLVCFPHAGGAASFFFPVSTALAPAVEVLAVQYPGRQDRRHDRPMESVAELADAVCAALVPWSDRPLLFFGHSMGAVVAFEVTRRLEAGGGVPPAVLVASGRGAPSRQRSEGVHLLDDDGVVAKIRRINGTDTRILGDDEVLRMVLPAIRADYTAVETYRATDAAVRCPVTAFVGDDDAMCTVPEARAWGEHTTGGFALRVFPGGHFYLADQREAVAEALREILSNLDD
jgi:surfactin synthase thioesterase subunit